jgi:catechol 2,3-dioxygenase-like lactoylglutathione lyase family enzyme
MTVTRIRVVSVPVSDQDRSLDFYVGVLGFELVSDSLMGDMRWVQVAPRGSECSLTLVIWFPTMPAGSLKGLVIETDQLDSDVEAIRAKGVVVEGVQDAPWGRFATFDDPDGNGIVLRDAVAW